MWLKKFTFGVLASAAVALTACDKTEDALLGPDPNQVTITVNVPTTTTQADTVKLVGSFKTDGWTPSKSPVVLRYKAPGVYETKIPVGTLAVADEAKNMLEFKFVRGNNWTSVEKTAACGNVDNRKMDISTIGGTTQTFTVGNWEDRTPCKK